MTDDGLIAPHGGVLVTNLAAPEERQELYELARSLPSLPLGARELADLEMLAIGAYSPLTGFLTRVDYESVVEEMHLSNGLPWTIPITLAVDSERAASLKEGQPLALVDGRSRPALPLAVLLLEEKYGYDKIREARQVYRTDDEAHPGVRALYQQGTVLLGGRVRVLALPEQPFTAYRYTPEQARRIFSERGWRRVVGFQTRNPVHRAHEYITNISRSARWRSSMASTCIRWSASPTFMRASGRSIFAPPSGWPAAAYRRCWSAFCSSSTSAPTTDS